MLGFLKLTMPVVITNFPFSSSTIRQWMLHTSLWVWPLSRDLNVNIHKFASMSHGDWNHHTFLMFLNNEQTDNEISVNVELFIMNLFQVQLLSGLPVPPTNSDYQYWNLIKLPETVYLKLIRCGSLSLSHKIFSCRKRYKLIRNRRSVFQASTNEPTITTSHYLGLTHFSRQLPKTIGHNFKFLSFYDVTKLLGQFSSYMGFKSGDRCFKHMLSTGLIANLLFSSLEFAIKKEGWGGGGTRHVKFVRGTQDPAMIKASGKTLTVSVPAGLPKDSSEYFFLCVKLCVPCDTYVQDHHLSDSMSHNL